jgi:hypothetical protein
MVALSWTSGPPAKQIVLASKGLSEDKGSKLVYRNLDDLRSDVARIAAMAEHPGKVAEVKKGPDENEKAGLPTKEDLKSGEKFWVLPNSLAKVIRKNGAYLYIEITSGPSVGQTGWIQEEYTQSVPDLKDDASGPRRSP